MKGGTEGTDDCRDPRGGCGWGWGWGGVTTVTREGSEGAMDKQGAAAKLW